jgi:hypothetical protein
MNNGWSFRIKCGHGQGADNSSPQIWYGIWNIISEKNYNWLWNMGWKKFAETKKGAADKVEHNSHVDCFFLHRGYCASWSLISGANSESLVLHLVVDLQPPKK